MKVTLELDTIINCDEWDIIKNMKAYIRFLQLLKEMHTTNCLNLTPLSQDEMVLVDELQSLLNYFKTKG